MAFWAFEQKTGLSGWVTPITPVWDSRILTDAVRIARVQVTKKKHSLLKIPDELSSRRCYHISDVFLLTEKREKNRRRTRNTVCTVNWTQDSLRPSVDFSVWNSKNFSSICDSLLSRTTFPFVCSSLYFSRIWYTLKHIKFFMKHVLCLNLKIGSTGPIKVIPKR